MPVTTSIPIHHFSQDDFGTVAYEVVGHAFEIHGTLGKKFHESVYRSTLQQIFGERSVEEMRILLTHQSFEKELFADLVVDYGCPFELKAAAGLTAAHESQLIQYLMLTGLSHGKLINFGAEQVEHKFVNCLESPEQRRLFQVDRHDWSKDTAACRFEDVLVSLVRDWGTGLTRSLYHEAVVALLGGEDRCRRFTQTHWQGTVTGRQPVDMIDEVAAFEITCMRRDLESFESHLRRFLTNTALESILWVNIVSGCVRFKRIGKGAKK
ncbi:MAG TPA: GxxExxY protein [Pirellulaceae bacterium]|nr:GxxExxY protein [Pirellulaceae bacterium]